LNRDASEAPFRNILIIGAGSGNDVSRALQWAAPDARIDAVEIDPVIQRLGRENHPDRPYQDPRVRVYLTDGRNFLRSTHRKYDLIVFALIDSLVLHSSVSNLRLESYLFTEEALEDVRRALAPGGLFVMYNYFRQGWIVARLAKTAGTAFARPPVVLTLPQRDAITVDQKAEGFTLIFDGPRAAAVGRAFRQKGEYLIPAGVAPGPSSPDGFGAPGGGNSIRLSPSKVEIPADLGTARDAWPFLYLRSPMIPNLVWRGILAMGLISLAMLRAFGWRTGGRESAGLHGTMLLLGAGFMLLETKAVVHGGSGDDPAGESAGSQAAARPPGALLPGAHGDARPEPGGPLGQLPWLAHAGARGRRRDLGPGAGFLCRGGLRHALPRGQETGAGAGLQHRRRPSGRIRGERFHVDRLSVSHRAGGRHLPGLMGAGGASLRAARHHLIASTGAPAPYCTHTATAGELAVPTPSTTAFWPEGRLPGTTAFTCTTPTCPGAAPENAMDAMAPPMVSMTGCSGLA
jgi:SAM-dependent methyltransferase